MNREPGQPPAQSTHPAGQASPAVGRHRLGAELRKLRKARSLHLSDAASRLGVAASTLSRIETGHAPARTAYLTILLDLYGVTVQAERDQLASLARDGQHKSWWTSHGDLLPPGAGPYLDLEVAASQIRCYSVQVIPALAQTTDYAAAACRATRTDLSAMQLSRLATIKQCRQELARGRQHLVIDQTALHALIGSARVMTGQLEHLVAITADPAVTVQVLPLATARSVLSSPFTILTFADPADPDTASSDDLSGQVTCTRQAVRVHAARRIFDVLAGLALPPANSAALIERTATRWRKQADDEH